MKYARCTWIVVAICLVLSVVSGAQTITLTFLGNDSGESERLLYERLFEEFERRHPNVKIEPIWGTSGAGAIMERLSILVAGGVAPDVFWVHSWIGADLVKNDLVLDLTPYIDQDPDIELSDYFPGSWMDFSYGGKVYALPRELATNVLYYNVDLFEQAGLELPGEDYTWDQYRINAAKLTRGEENQRVYGGRSARSSFEYVSMAMQRGGSIADPVELRSTFNTPPVIDTLQFIADLMLQDNSHPTPMQSSADPGITFTSGRAAQEFNGYYRNGSLQRADLGFEYDVAPMPSIDGKTHITASAASAHSVYRGTQHPKEAYELVKFLSGPEASRAYGADGVVIPPLREVALSPDFLGDGAPRNRYIFVWDLQYSRPFPVTPNWSQVLSVIGKHLATVWTGETPVESAVIAIDDEVTPIMRR